MGAAISRWMKQLRYYLEHLGWQGSTGLLLLAACLVAAVAYAWPQARALDQLKQDMAEMRRAMPQHQGQWIDRSPQASLNTFYGFLPREQEATALLNQVLQIAEQHGLVPDKVDYSLTRHPSAYFSRYQLTLPLHGSYLDIRRFIADVLSIMPSAALNEATFKREDLSNEQVSARLKLTLYIQKDGQ